jgi:farnesyl diphosphate synthase
VQSFESQLQEVAAALAGRLALVLAEGIEKPGSETRGGNFPAGGPEENLLAAMRAAVLAGGKRLRPFLVIKSAALFDVPEDQALTCATALEMVHAYSLVHDDLPAMDDSDLRRGQPSLHRAFGEATAILAGDGLLTEAFALLSRRDSGIAPETALELIAALAEAAGCRGMVAGQAIDLSAARNSLDLPAIIRLQALKTGALFDFACRAGAILGRAGPAERQALADFAAAFGLIFQIGDDLLDMESTSVALGKPVGQDIVRGKATFPGLLGPEDARRRLHGLVQEALDHLAVFDNKAEPLRQAVRFIASRKN